MALKAVIFDLGGVILRTEDQSPRRKWEARLGLREGEVERAVFGCKASARASVGKAPEQEVWHSVAERFGFNHGDAEQFRRDFFAGDQIDAGLVQFLSGLRPRFKTAILSNAWLDLRKNIIEPYHLAQAVDTVVISAEEGIAKPEARIYHIAAERLGVSPSEAIFVDDVTENIVGAQNVGMRGAQFDLQKFGTSTQFVAHLQTLLAE